jgi:hypothetical protein
MSQDGHNLLHYPRLLGLRPVAADNINGMVDHYRTQKPSVDLLRNMTGGFARSPLSPIPQSCLWRPVLANVYGIHQTSPEH